MSAASARAFDNVKLRQLISVRNKLTDVLHSHNFLWSAATQSHSLRQLKHNSQETVSEDSLMIAIIAQLLGNVVGMNGVSVLEHHLVHVKSSSPRILVLFQRTSERRNLRTFLFRTIVCSVGGLPPIPTKQPAAWVCGMQPLRRRQRL